MKSLWKLANAIHLGLYRLTSGRIGGRMGDGTILLLTTTGRKTGKARTVPVLYFLDDNGNPVVTASNAGLPKNPAWFENLRVNPRVTYQIGAERKIARADTTRTARPAVDEAHNQFQRVRGVPEEDHASYSDGHTPSGFLIGAFG
jgi:deazaflavin-dependent oxidoreductase (nitroreductase family)